MVVNWLPLSISADTCLFPMDTVAMGDHRAGRATSALPQILNEDMAKAQAADAAISRAILYVRRGQPSNRTERKAEEQGTRRLLKDFHRLTLDGGVLHRETRSPEAHQRQIILPAVFRKAAIIKLHDEMGHQG